MNLRVFDTAADVVRAAARTVLQRIEGQIEGRDQTVVGVSGGSTPKPLYELLGAAPHRDRLAAQRVTWVVVDERYVPTNHPQSNAGMIRASLLRGEFESHHFLGFRTDLGDPERTVVHFEQEWHALGLQRLDLVLLGVGEDGHTASLFPGTPVLEVEDRVAAAVFVPGLDQWRVTLTLPVIRSARLRIVLATGEGKAAVVRDVAAGIDHPVTRVMSGEGESWWFIDQAAAGELS